MADQVTIAYTGASGSPAETPFGPMSIGETVPDVDIQTAKKLVKTGQFRIVPAPIAEAPAAAQSEEPAAEAPKKSRKPNTE
jgi:hypothetical protein